MWPEEVNEVAPGVKVTDPATRLVGFPTNVIPSRVYVDRDGPLVLALVLVAVLVVAPVSVAALGEGKAVVLPSTWICPPVALAGIPTVCPAVVKGGSPGCKVTVPATRLVGLPVNVIPSMV